MSKKSLRSFLLGISVVALCAVLTLPVLAAPPTSPAVPAFLARIWRSIEALISGPAPPQDDPGVSELRRVAGNAGPGFEPIGASLELVDPDSTDQALTSVSLAAVPGDETDGTSVP
jgi:hypothetical protein